MAKILEDEYDENKIAQKPEKLEYDEFQNILDSHIVDMDVRKRDKGPQEDPQKRQCTRNYDKKGNKGKDGNMLEDMANNSDDEDFDENHMDNAIMQETKGHNAGKEFLNEELEVLTKWIKGKEYKSEHITSSAGGKLIINTIIKKTKKGKKQQKKDFFAEDEKDTKKSS